METSLKFKTVYDYLVNLPENIREILQILRNTIKQTVPEAEELISYNMPAFRYYGILVYYAVHNNHIGFYPGSSVTNSVFKDDLLNYKTSKGTIQFALGKDLPLDLIKKIVLYRMNENIEKTNKKLKSKK